MAERFLIYKGAEDLRKGDLFISVFGMKGCEFPEPRAVLEVIKGNEVTTLIFEDEEINIVKGMRVIVQDKTPMVDPLKEGVRIVPINHEKKGMRIGDFAIVIPVNKEDDHGN